MEGIFRLPLDCIARIVSLMTPVDACRVLAVSKEFRPPAESNLVWHKFLPPDCRHITIATTSLKELFFLLTNSILIDDGHTAFGLEKSSGQKVYMLSARRLSILHGDISNNWTWKSIPESRFTEVAELISVERLQIQSTISAELLSPNTKYGAYLVFKISDKAFGLDSIPYETSIAFDDHVPTTNTARLVRDLGNKKQLLESLFYGNRVERMKERVNKGMEMRAEEREDGWMEVEIGEFFVGENSENGEIIRMSFNEVKGYQLKGGLIVEGIEVRPKN